MLGILIAGLVAASQSTAAADGGSRLVGRVVTAYPAGASSVIVTLRRVDRTEAERRTTTDANGRFSFDRVPDGRYVAIAEKPGYTTKRLNSTDPRFDTGVALTLRRGQPTADVEIPLWRAASIDGRVIRSDGAAAPGIHVVLARRRGGSVVPLQDTQVTTAWDGRYAMTGLPPGDYLVLASGVGRTSSTGSLPTASPEQAAFEINLTRADEFRPTLYPGVPTTERGATVTLLEGLATSGVDVWLAPARRSSISGRVTWPEAAIVEDITIEYGNPSHGRASIWTVADPGGLFTIDAVTPGTVVLLASADSNRGRLMGVVSADVQADNVDDVTLALVAPARVEGRVVFPSTLPAAARPRTIRLLPRLLNVSPLYAIPDAPIADDGTFSVENVLGEYEFELPGLSDRFRIASVTRGAGAFHGNRIGVATGEIVDQIVVTVGARQ